MATDHWPSRRFWQRKHLVRPAQKRRNREPVQASITRTWIFTCSAEWTRAFYRVSRNWRARCHGCVGSRIIHLQYRSRARVPHRTFDGRRRYLDSGIETCRKICRHRANRGQWAVGKIETRQTACRSTRAIFTRGKGYGRAGRTRATHRKTVGKVYEKFHL